MAWVYYAFVHVRAEHRFINKRTPTLASLTATVRAGIRQFQVSRSVGQSLSRVARCGYKVLETICQ